MIDDLHARYTDPSVLNTATFLDPHFKTDYCENKEDVKEWIQEQAKEFMQQESTGNQSTAPKSPPPKKKKLNAFLKREESYDLSPEARIVRVVLGVPQSWDRKWYVSIEMVEGT